MRIAFTIHDARPGGGQDRYGLELVNRLSERHEVTLFARSSEGLAPGVIFNEIGTPTRPSLLRDRTFSARVRRRTSADRWDIVHTVGGAVPGATVITAQFCHVAARAAARRWPSGLVGRVEQVFRHLDSLGTATSERQAARHPRLRALIGVSNRTLDEWRTGYNVTAPVCAVIPNGVDVSRFRQGDESDRQTIRTELSIPSSSPILLLVGALVRKGVETALEALAQLDHDAYLVAVGAGPHGAVSALAERLGVKRQLRLVTPMPDIERYYRGADIFLFPTRYEPFGMVVAEAWAAGLPVVAAETAGALEWAAHNEEVLKVADPTDATAFADATALILKDSGLATRLSKRGRAIANQLSWDRVVRETEAVYEQALSSG